MKKIINIKEPDISKVEKREVLKCLNQGEISTYGKLVSNIDKNLSNYNGAKYNLPLNSGSAALLLAFKSIGIAKGDIVITQSFTFGATIHAIVNSQAQPWLFDIDKFSLSINLDQLEKTLNKKIFFKNGHSFLKKNKKRVYAICPVTSFGIIPDLSKLKKIALKYNLKIVIDGACAFGNKYYKQNLVQLSDVVVYSFNGNKNFTSGGGGALSTNKKNIYNKAKILAENGKSKHAYIYKMIGHNYKMTNIHAAILKAQLSRFHEIKYKLLFNHNEYKKKINNNNFEFFTNQKITSNISWLNFILCKSNSIAKKLIHYLRNNKINTNYFWTPIHLQSISKSFMKENLNFTEKFFKRIVLIPSSSSIKKKEINYVINLLNKFVDQKS